jgi:putative IMPACT (imprinted ancient) family translation regulator
VNTLAVVIREYGGIKLGKSGLISAYSDAIDLAINQAELIPQQAC